MQENGVSIEFKAISTNISMSSDMVDVTSLSSFGRRESIIGCTKTSIEFELIGLVVVNGQDYNIQELNEELCRDIDLGEL